VDNVEGIDPGSAVIRLHDELDRALAAVVPRRARVALINYPNHHNVGDPALYLGTLRALRRLGARVVYACEHGTYARATLGAKVRSGIDAILINGGGNLGDQYEQQDGRERVLTDFPEVPTVQLSQSIWFADAGRRDRFGEIVAGHRDLTLMLRDEASMAVAREHFTTRLVLAPDMAFGLGPLARPAAPVAPIAWLRRVDREAAGATDAAPDALADPFDWVTATPDEAVGGAIGRVVLRTNARLRAAVASRPYLWRPLWWTFQPLAAHRLDYGLRLLARGQVVVSDRLHGVILPLLMGIPAVAVDNSNGKVASFIATWLADEPSVRLASSHREALEIAGTIG
jgi:exopolysaccharide biosynthesis predicted pyruvyltransferase EpsI